MSIFVNIFVLFFSLNFNSFLFAPTFAEEILNQDVVDETIEQNINATDGLSGETQTVLNGEQDSETQSPDEDQIVSDEINGELSGDVGGEVDSGSNEFLDEELLVPGVGTNFDEILTGGGSSFLSGDIQEIIEETLSGEVNNPGNEDNLTGDNNTGNQFSDVQIDQDYFDYAFEKGSYDAKIFDLQNILKSLGFFHGDINGTYDNKTIEAVYQYQLAKGILTTSDDVGLRGFFGPGTREFFNQEYIMYKQNLIDGISNIFVSGPGNSQSIENNHQELLQKMKKYFIDNKYSLQNIFGTGVFVGKKDIDFSLLSGHILLPVIFQSENTLDGNMAEVSFEEGTVLKTEDGSLFTGSLSSPEFLPEDVADELLGQDVISVLDVGGNDEKIVLEDVNGQEITSKVKIPVPGQMEGSLLDINYSHDGENRLYLTSQKVFLDEGEPYIEFETNHFTIFSISLPVGTFFINNDAFSTNGTNVTLNSNVSGATHMRFANTAVGVTGASWVDYATGYSWTLNGTSGYNTVYAQFSGYYGTWSASDSIFLDNMNTGTNLKVMLAGNMNGTHLLDSTYNANHFSGMGGLSNVSLNGRSTLSFNGTSQYANRSGIGLTAYPFTVSAWVNATKVGGKQAIVMIGNSASNTVYRGIQLSGFQASIVAMNTTLYGSQSAIELATGMWYHIVGVFASATSRTLYVNGARVATNATSVTFSATNPQITVGKYVGGNTNYFSGYIDDVRIYNKTLVIQEIITLYNSRLSVRTFPTQYLHDGQFSINGDAPSTYTTGVILNSDVTGMTHMRFANTTGELTSASWVSYATGYSWFLVNGGTGNRIVYAQYSGVGGVRDAQDNIFLDSATADTNLKILLAGNMNGSNVVNSTNNTYHFSGINGISSVVTGGETVLSLNGTSQFAHRSGLGVITAYPFTFSARVNPSTLAGTDAIVVMGNSGTTTMYWAIQLVNGAPSMVASNTTARLKTSSMILATGQRYHIVGVFASTTDRRLYVNGVKDGTVGTTTAVTYATTASAIRVGRYMSTSTNYFHGYVDDVRIYNDALTTGEILQMYKDRTTRFIGPTARIEYSITGSTSNPVVATLTGFSENGVSIQNNNGSGIYVFTGNGNFTFFFKDTDGNIGSTIATVDWITPSAGSVSISGPVNFSFGTTGVAGIDKFLEKSFSGATSDYFKVEDSLGADAGYYTTLSFSDLQYGAYTIPKANIYVKNIDGIATISGTPNANVVTAITGIYLGAGSPLTFIKRDAGANGGKTGVYGAYVGIKINIPALQQPADYTGTIIYTLY